MHYKCYLILMVIGLYVLEDEGGVGTIEVPPNVGPTIKAIMLSRRWRLQWLHWQFHLSKQLRTGRASPGIFMRVTIVYRSSVSLDS